MSTLRSIVLALAACLLATAPLAARATETSEEKSLSKGRFVVRGNAGIDLDKTINIGGNNPGETVAGALNLGVGYFLIDNLSLDLDLDLRFTLAPAVDITTLGVTPGASSYPIPQVYVRAGVPIILIPDLDIGVLEFSQFGFPVLRFEFEEHGSQNFAVVERGIENRFDVGDRDRRAG